jgi:hypothetical protein
LSGEELREENVALGDVHIAAWVALDVMGTRAAVVVETELLSDMDVMGTRAVVEETLLDVAIHAVVVETELLSDDNSEKDFPD